MYTRRYALYGALLGFAFPVVGTLIEAFTRGYGLGLAGLVHAQARSPLLWIIDTAPAILGALASYAGRAQDQIIAVDEARREGYLQTASELFIAAQALLSTVSSFSSMTAETAASVRETTATMGQLGHTATQAALTAETVIGLARVGDRASAEGISAVEACLGELMKLTDDVRGLSGRIQALNGRMRDVTDISALVSSIADRSHGLAERTAEAARAGRGVGEIASEMRSHADDAKRAAVHVKTILGEIQKAMLAATSAAQVGVRRAEHGASVASTSGETIRRLAGALRDSSQAAKEIATVAQQQDHGIDQVLKAMNEIYLATQETMSSTQAVATEAKALNDLASGLKRAVEA